MVVVYMDMIVAMSDVTRPLCWNEFIIGPPQLRTNLCLDTFICPLLHVRHTKSPSKNRVNEFTRGGGPSALRSPKRHGLNRVNPSLNQCPKFGLHVCPKARQRSPETGHKSGSRCPGEIIGKI